MGISLIGYDIFSASQNVSHAVTVPVNTDYLLVWFNGYPRPAVSGVLFNGTAMTEILTGDGGTSKTGTYGLVSPSIGEHTLAATVDAAFSEGAIWGCAFFSGIDTINPVRDSDTSACPAVLTLDCAADDYGFICVGGDVYPSYVTGLTEIANLNELSQIGSMAGVLIVSGISVDLGTTNGNYSTQVTIVLRAASSSGVTIPVIMDHLRGQGVS